MNNNLIEVIETFENSLKKYRKALIDFILGEYDKYKIEHPELNKLSNELQGAFVCLPEIVTERLLKMEFEIFLHCNNEIDFYNFRKHLKKDSDNLDHINKITRRVEAELSLVKILIKRKNFDKYKQLPQRNFNFYRENSNNDIFTKSNNKTYK